MLKQVVKVTSFLFLVGFFVSSCVQGDGVVKKDELFDNKTFADTTDSQHWKTNSQITVADTTQKVPADSTKK